MIAYENRKGQTYFLKVGTTKKGNPKYYFSMKAAGKSASAIPDGFEIYENVNGLVTLRRKTTSEILPEEIELFDKALRELGAIVRYEVQRDSLIVFENSLADGLSNVGVPAFFRVDPEEQMARHGHYQPILKFELVDKKKRFFGPLRMCYRSPDDHWICIGEAIALRKCLQLTVPHIGKDSFFELGEY